MASTSGVEKNSLKPTHDRFPVGTAASSSVRAAVLVASSSSRKTADGRKISSARRPKGSHSVGRISSGRVNPFYGLLLSEVVLFLSIFKFWTSQNGSR